MMFVPVMSPFLICKHVNLPERAQQVGTDFCNTSGFDALHAENMCAECV